MTQQNTPTNGANENNKTFAYVIDGEVVFISHVDSNIEFLIAILSSNPTVVQVPEESRYDCTYGWTYSDGVYSPPA
jgi:hypothetical protein